MGLSVNSSLNSGKYLNCGTSSATSVAFGNTKKPYEDKSSDGKFSCSEAVRNFARGLISPITSMFSSPKNFLVGVGMTAGSMALIAATGGAAAPILVAAGIGIGAIQAGKAAYGIATAKNGDDIERAFYDVGGATSAIGLSAAGAKSALKQANMETEGLNLLNSIKKCFSSSKTLASESFNVFKTGYFKTNIANALKVAKQPQKLRKYARELSEDTKHKFENSFNALRDTLPDEYKPFLKGRSKSEISMYEKMVKELGNIDEQIKQLKKSPKAENNNITEMKEAEALKASTLKRLLAERKKIVTNAAAAKSKVEDGYGARLILDDVSPANMEKLMQHLIDSVKRGDIEITEIENYNGANAKFINKNEPYFSPAKIKELCKATGDIPLSQKPKASGYTAVQLKVRPKGGEVMELQIRGKYMDEIANWEHIPYDLRQGKDIARGNNQAGLLTTDIKNAIAKLTEEQYNSYQKYVYDNYIYARAKESNITVDFPEPKLPEGIDPILDAKNLKGVHENISKMPSAYVRNPFEMKSQAGLIASTESLIDE